MSLASAAAVVLFAPQATAGPDPKVGKKVIFAEEFSGKGHPDPKTWIPEVGKIRNNEAQYYTKNRLENARVEGGRLIIEARKEAYKGSDVTSASITTAKTFTHAYVEVRAKFPTGKGTWPAIWMLGDSIRQPEGKGRVDWPACGEIDMMENVGFNPESVHFSVHNTLHNHVQGTQVTKVIKVPKAWENYHVYGLDWTKDKLDFYFDGAKVLTYDRPSDPTGWPFDKPHYIILNLAIGGFWGGAQGIDDHIFPSRFEVDYVRVYQAPKA